MAAALKRSGQAQRLPQPLPDCRQDCPRRPFGSLPAGLAATPPGGPHGARSSAGGFRAAGEARPWRARYGLRGWPSDGRRSGGPLRPLYPYLAGGGPCDSVRLSFRVKPSRASFPASLIA
ncbi:hypothetical protein D3C74_254850 [compost metagenome]